MALLAKFCQRCHKVRFEQCNLWFTLKNPSLFHPLPVRLMSVTKKTNMKEHGILFKGSMVQALLANRKTQTRRLKSPRWKVSDHLWVRETWKPTGLFWAAPNMETKACDRFAYSADQNQLDRDKQIKWRPSIFMPRWASRITLEVEAIRSERLQEITENDAEAEGIQFMREIPDADETLTAIQLYDILWESINGKSSWNQNLIVHVTSFKIIKPKLFSQEVMADVGDEQSMEREYYEGY